MERTLLDSDVNVLAQRFFEASGLTQGAVTKPQIVAGLEAVLRELDIEVVNRHEMFA